MNILYIALNVHGTFVWAQNDILAEYFKEIGVWFARARNFVLFTMVQLAMA